MTKPAHCNACPRPGVGFLPFDQGAMASGVLLVGETLSTHDAEQSKALVGHAGHFMGRALARTRREWVVRESPGGGPPEVQCLPCGPFGRDEWGYTVVGRCQQPDVRPKGKLSGPLVPNVAQALDHCQTYLQEEITRREPRAIVAFGSVAFRALTGLDLEAADCRGYVFPDRDRRTWVIPTYDPNYLLRGNQALVPAFLWDLDRARELARGSFAYDTLDCLVDPPVGVWDRWVTDAIARWDRGSAAGEPGPVLALDIETPYKQGANEGTLRPEDDPTFAILDISFALDGRGGVTVPWGMPYLVGIDRLLRAAAARPWVTTIAWNGAYDFPRVRRALGEGVLPPRQVQDPMLRWHTLFNSVDMGLGFATSANPLSSMRLPAWKHLGSENAYYRVADAVALWRNHRDINLLVKATGQAFTTRLFTERLPPILHTMAAGGLLVSEEQRQAAEIHLRDRLLTLETHMTQVVPEALRPVAQWQKRALAEAGLARLQAAGAVLPGAEVYEAEVLKAQKVCGACGQVGVTKAHVTKKTLRAEDLCYTPDVEDPA